MQQAQQSQIQWARFTFVFISAAVLSGFMGYLGGLPYGQDLAGVVFGAGAGLFAACMWVKRVVPRLEVESAKHPGTTGGVYGMLVGMLATLILHGTLALLSGKANGDWLFIGLICGALSGFILGEICGRIANRLVRSRRMNRRVGIDEAYDIEEPQA